MKEITSVTMADTFGAEVAACTTFLLALLAALLAVVRVDLRRAEAPAHALVSRGEEFAVLLAPTDASVLSAIVSAAEESTTFAALSAFVAVDFRNTSIDAADLDCVIRCIRR